MTDMPGVPAILRGAAAALLVAGVAACGVATPTSGGAATLAASAGGRPSSAATGQPPGTCLRRIGITVDGVLPVEYVFAATGSLAGAECAGVGDVVAQLNGTSVMVAAVPPGWRMACGTTSGATLWTVSSAVALTVCQGVPGRPTLPRVCGCDQADGSQPTQAAVRPSRAQRT